MLASVMQMQLLPAVLALAAFLVAILLTLYIVRMLFGRRIRVSGGRNRPKRLDIVDAFDLDRERQLVIVRRDNVEHLLLIGGPSDVLIEAGFERSVVAAQAEGRPEGRVPTPTSTPGWPSPPEEEEAEETPRAARVPSPPPGAGPREAQPASGALSVDGLRRRFSEVSRPAPRPPEPPRAPAGPPAPGARPQAPQPGRMGPPPPRGPEPQQWEGPGGAPGRPAAPAEPRPASPPGLGPRPAAPSRPGAPPLTPRPPRPAAPPPAAPPPGPAPTETPPQETAPNRPARESLESLESLEAEMARLLGRPEGH